MPSQFRPRTSLCTVHQTMRTFLAIFAKFCKFLAGSFSAVSKRNFARKYAFDSIFQALQDLHPFAPLQSQNFRKKSVWKNSNFREISAKRLQMSQTLQNFVKLHKFQLENLVDFEKCCKTHIFLQKSVPIQPKTSNPQMVRFRFHVGNKQMVRFRFHVGNNDDCGDLGDSHGCRERRPWSRRAAG